MRPERQVLLRTWETPLILGINKRTLKEVTVKWFRMLIGMPVLLAWLGAAPGSESARNPDPTEGNTAKMMARILEQAQFSHHPFNDEIAKKFFDRYLDALDAQHLNFFQSDIDEIRPYATTLDELTKAGNTGPAHDIYNRFMHRVEQRVAYVTDLLKSEKFDFNGNDRYVLDRKGEPWPKDLDEARQLWRQRARFEYLQDLLNKKKPEQIV